MGLQTQTTKIYLHMFMEDSLEPGCVLGPGISLHSNQAEAPPSWSLPFRAFHYGEVGIVEGIRPASAQALKFLLISSHLLKRWRDQYF